MLRCQTSLRIVLLLSQILIFHKCQLLKFAWRELSKCVVFCYIVLHMVRHVNVHVYVAVSYQMVQSGLNNLKRRKLLKMSSNSNSNYCSFIYRPFKEVYSGALPAQPRSNNVVLRLERKRAEWSHRCQTQRKRQTIPSRRTSHIEGSALSDNSPRSEDQRLRLDKRAQ